MNLESIATYLEDQGVARPGKSLFLYFMPSGATLPAVMLRTPLTGTPINYELRNYVRGSFQAIVRTGSNDYQAGLDLMKLVMATLTIENSTALSGMSIKRIWPKHEPVTFPSSKADCNEISVNFEAVYVIVP